MGLSQDLGLIVIGKVNPFDFLALPTLQHYGNITEKPFGRENFLFWSIPATDSAGLPEDYSLSALSKTRISPAAIDCISDPGNKTSFFRGQEQYELCDFFGLPYPTQWVRDIRAVFQE